MAKDAEAGVVVVYDVINVITRLFCTRLVLGSTRSKAHILVTCREDPHERRHNLFNGVSKLLADNLTFALNLVSNQVNMTEGKAPTFVGSTAVYLTDFGTLDITPSRFMSNDKLFVIDPNFVSLSTLAGRNFAENDIANTGDAEKSQIVCEWALKVKAPKAHGACIGLNGS